MELIKAAIKAVFYDYPVQKLIEEIGNQSNRSTLLSSARFLINYRENSFSLSELEALISYIKTLCKNSDSKYSYTDYCDDDYSSCFVLLYETANRILTYASGEARVIFNQLFKWQDLVRYLGEDLMVVPFLAHKDLEFSFHRTEFLWESVIGHNNTDLNALLDHGLCDVHSHLGASTEIVELNWINIMNSIRDVSKLARKHLNQTKDYEPQISIEGKRCSPEFMYVVAASIRVALHKHLIQKEEFPHDALKEVLSLSDDLIGLRTYKTNLQNKINALRLSCSSIIDRNKWDYALANTNDTSSPYKIYAGERMLFYEYFRRLASGEQSLHTISKYVFLYESIKIRFRKEFIQTNSIVGLANFSEYNDRKSALLHNGLKAIKTNIAIKTSIRAQTSDALEARVNLDYLDEIPRDIRHPDLKNVYGWTNIRSIASQLTFVVHFIKEKDKANDAYESYTYRNHHIERNLERQVKTLVQKKHRRRVPLLSGIDAAGMELNCRPEVFGQLFRYYQASCDANVTYHVGEDFYDLADGLRAIEETVVFCHMRKGSRLGHCLALGIDTLQYYSKRYYCTIIPKQVLLDNIVWTLVKIEEYNISSKITSKTKFELQVKARELYAEIGYGELNLQFDLLSYYNSIYLRSDNTFIDESRLDKWSVASKCTHQKSVLARKDQFAIILRDKYKTDFKIKQKGEETTIYNFPQGYDVAIEGIQYNLMLDLSKLGIGIECNPTSNLRIGHFDKYDQHPIFRFMHMDGKLNNSSVDKICASINTDDKGIFATSLKNEYSLIALAILKMKDQDGKNIYNQETMLKFVAEIIENNRKQRFTID